MKLRDKHPKHLALKTKELTSQKATRRGKLRTALKGLGGADFLAQGPVH